MAVERLNVENGLASELVEGRPVNHIRGQEGSPKASSGQKDGSPPSGMMYQVGFRE